jgi:hypothetical protein
MCGEGMEAPESWAGQLLECPVCGCYIEVPGKEQMVSSILSVSEKTQTTNQSNIDNPMSYDTPEQAYVHEQMDATNEMERKHPLFIDILCYPANSSGLIHIGIFILLRIVWKVFFVLTMAFGGFWTMCVMVTFGVITYGYIYHYFASRVYDSAKGGIRAPETLTMGGEADFSQLRAQLFRIFVPIILCFGPAFIFRRIAGDANPYFWILRGSGMWFQG